MLYKPSLGGRLQEGAYGVYMDLQRHTSDFFQDFEGSSEAAYGAYMFFSDRTLIL